MTSHPQRTAFQWSDPLLLEQQLSDDERQVRDAARAYSQQRLGPRVLEPRRSFTAR
jgi:glutaryl-CoA dehydrogenase